MAFPLGTILATAPGLISAATEIIRLLKQRKSTGGLPDQKRLDELAGLVEKQAQLIEELAVNNRNMAIVVRNNRILSVFALSISIISIGALLV